MNTVLDEFEKFRKMDPYWLKNQIDVTIKRLEDIKGCFCGKTE